MLAQLDVLIGTVVVLLGVSLVITVINQTLSNALALRGRNLRWGLTTLIQELHRDRFIVSRGQLPVFGRGLDKDVAEAVNRILTHPLISDSKLPVGWWRLASAIRFEEFVKTLAMLGREDTTLRRLDEGSDKTQDALDWLRENHRITEPWFNSVMDRVSQRFLMHIRVYTVAVAVVVVAILGMDTLHVIRTLRSEAALRNGLVAAADKLSAAAPLETDATQALENYRGVLTTAVADDQSVSKLLVAPVTDWTLAGFWRRAEDRLPGMLLSIVLLSLGAPFWFAVLKNIVALRSVVAKKEGQERARASTTPDVGDLIQVRSF